MKGYDVIVIGGGGTGLVAAQALVAQGASLLLLDDADSNARSIWSDPGRLDSWGSGLAWPDAGNLIKCAMNAWPDFAAMLKNESGVDVGFQRNGSVRLWLDEDGHSSSIGQEGECLDRAALDAWLGEDRIGPKVEGGLFVAEDGVVNARGLYRALLSLIISRGGHYRADGRVVTLIPTGVGFQVQSWNQRYFGETVLLAAGVGNVGLARRMGLDPPLVPETAQTLVTESCEHFLDKPFGQITQRHDGAVLIGPNFHYSGLDARLDPSLAGDAARRATALLPTINSLKLMEVSRVVRAKTPDGLPLYHAWNDQPRLFMVNGSHAISLAAAHDRLLSEWILEGRLPDLLSPLTMARFAGTGLTADPAFGKYDREHYP